MKIAFAGGGTAGHLMVGLSTAEEIRSRFNEAEIIFFGTDKEFEKRCVEQRGFRFRQMHAKKWGKSFKHLFAFTIATLRFANLIRTLWLDWVDMPLLPQLSPQNYSAYHLYYWNKT